MQSALRKFGNSTGVIIPKALLTEVGAQAGDKLILSVEAGRIVIDPVAVDPRAGWAEVAAEIAAAGDEEFVWEDYVEDHDDEWVW